MVQTKITIVGRNHFKNITLALEERIFLQREPENTYDENAIAAYKQQESYLVMLLVQLLENFHRFLVWKILYQVLFQVVPMENSDALSLSQHR